MTNEKVKKHRTLGWNYLYSINWEFFRHDGIYCDVVEPLDKKEFPAVRCDSKLYFIINKAYENRLASSKWIDIKEFIKDYSLSVSSREPSSTYTIPSSMSPIPSSFSYSTSEYDAHVVADVVPKAPTPLKKEYKQTLSVAKVGWMEIFIDQEDEKLFTVIDWKNVSITPESIAVIKKDLSTAKKLVVKFSEEVAELPKFKLSDRVLLIWPTWTGKTHEFHAVANGMRERGEIDFIEKITITEGFEDIDFLSYIVPQESGWIKYQEREVITTLREAVKGKKVALCLDELNRGSRSFMNFILTLLDWVEGDNYVLNNFIKDEKLIIPIDNVLVFATMNMGSKYTWTSALDEALMDRFSHVNYVNYKLDNEESLIVSWFWKPLTKTVKEIVKYVRGLHAAWEIRSSISTRGVKVWASAYLNSLKTKGDLRRTFESTLLYRLVNMDDYGNPLKEDIMIIMKKFKELGFME